MNYKRIFDPELFPTPAEPSAEEGAKPGDGGDSQATGDESDGGFVDRAGPYVYFNDRLVLAINVALATHRPLVLRGAPGCGKSSLAADLALRLGWSYLPYAVTSRTQAQDLKWRFDAVRRLGDAQARPAAEAGGAATLERYIVPGVLWWAFDPESARRRGWLGEGVPPFTPAEPPGSFRNSPRAVILLDEIDKADPEVPNDLLSALGALQFVVSETDRQVAADRKRSPLVLITSNDERELPEAFLRRCVVMRMQVPDTVKMLRIASSRFPKAESSLLDQIGARFEHFRRRADARHQRIPGTAEFLDTVRACLRLNVTADSDVWDLVTETTLWKQTTATEAEGETA